MQNRLFIILALCSAINAEAQETEQPEAKNIPGKHEIGLFAEPLNDTWDNGGHTNNFGVQYKHWVKPNIAQRILIATGDYNSNDYTSYQRHGDTIFQTSSYTYIPMYYAGWGLEVQRQFYKKVVLYAAFELQAGYGSGRSDITLTKEIWNNQSPYLSPVHLESSFGGSSTTSAFSFDITPFIGAKLNFRRWCLGTEVTGIRAQFENINFSSTGSTVSNSNFNMGQFRQRIYFNYRF